MPIKCKCGSTSYRTEQTGPHLKAICTACNQYIQFLPQPIDESSLMYFGKYKGKPLHTIPTEYFAWLYENNKLNGSLKNYVQNLLNCSK